MIRILLLKYHSSIKRGREEKNLIYTNREHVVLLNKNFKKSEIIVYVNC